MCRHNLLNGSLFKPIIGFLCRPAFKVGLITQIILNGVLGFITICVITLNRFFMSSSPLLFDWWLLCSLAPYFYLLPLYGGDGLVQRDLRRFGVGRESVFKYHHAKKVVFPVMLLAWGLYLSISFSIHPNWILIPSAIFLGLTILFTASSFKKYLWSEMSYLYFKALQA